MCPFSICAECAHESGILAVTQYTSALANLRQLRARAGRRERPDFDSRIEQLVRSRMGFSYRCPSCRYWTENPFSSRARALTAPPTTPATPPTLDQGRRLFSEVYCVILTLCATPAEMEEQNWLRLANRLAERVPLDLRGDLVFVARAAHELFRCEGHIAAYLSLRRWESGIPGRDADGLLQASELQQGEILACLAQLLPPGPDRPNPWEAVDALAANVLRVRHCSSGGVASRAAEVARGAQVAAAQSPDRDLDFQRFSLIYVSLLNFCTLPGDASVAHDVERMLAFFAPGNRPTLRVLFSRLRLLCGPTRGRGHWIHAWEAAVRPNPG